MNEEIKGLFRLKKAESEWPDVVRVCKLAEFSTLSMAGQREVPSWSEASSWLPKSFYSPFPLQTKTPSRRWDSVFSLSIEERTMCKTTKGFYEFSRGISSHK